MTKIFKTYQDFLNREDKDDNGVSPDFAAANSRWEKDNESNIGCYNCLKCYNCTKCHNCYDCCDCCDCVRCYDCYDRFGKKSNRQVIEIPKIDNIHQRVFEAVSQPDALDMSDWHTCNTTHCRAGWVVHLAGPLGYELEKQTSTEFAAMMLYKKSSPIRVSPARFYETAKDAMADMKRCAEEEELKAYLLNK